MFDFYLIFPIPNATSELFNWDHEVLIEVWGYYIVILAILILISKIWFYFFSYPTKKALINFWLSCAIEYFITSLLGYILIYNYYLELAGQSGFISIIQYFVLLIFFTIDYIIASIIILTILLMLGYISAQLNYHTRIRALRKYPFKFVK